jgi:hypothetical protein
MVFMVDSRGSPACAKAAASVKPAGVRERCRAKEPCRRPWIDPGTREIDDMASANKSKGTSEEGKVPRPDKSNTASKGMAERPKGGAAGDPEAEVEEDVDYVRPPGKDPTETGRLRD